MPPLSGAAKKKYLQDKRKQRADRDADPAGDGFERVAAQQAQNQEPGGRQRQQAGGRRTAEQQQQHQQQQLTQLQQQQQQQQHSGHPPSKRQQQGDKKSRGGGRDLFIKYQAAFQVDVEFLKRDSVRPFEFTPAPQQTAAAAF